MITNAVRTISINESLNRELLRAAVQSVRNCWKIQLLSYLLGMDGKYLIETRVQLNFPATIDAGNTFPPPQ